MVSEKLRILAVGNFFKVLTVLASMMAALVFTVAALNEYIDSRTQLDEFSRMVLNPQQLIPLKAEEVEKLQLSVASLSKTVAGLESLEGFSPENIRLVSIESKLESLSSRLVLLEAAISNNPERALSVPMLRKDHDTLAKQVGDSGIALKLDYDRLWGMLMLILTVAGTAVLGVGGWVFKGLVSQPSKILVD